MATQEAGKIVCPTCMGNKVLSGVCETSPEWDGVETPDQKESLSGMDTTGDICTPDVVCPTCHGKGYV